MYVSIRVSSFGVHNFALIDVVENIVYNEHVDFSSNVGVVILMYRHAN